MQAQNFSSVIMVILAVLLAVLSSLAESHNNNNMELTDNMHSSHNPWDSELSHHLSMPHAPPVPHVSHKHHQQQHTQQATASKKSEFRYPSGMNFTGRNITAAFFANWAKYRNASFGFYPQNLTDIITKIDILYYGFAFFCPDSNMEPIYWADNTDRYANYCIGTNGYQPFELFGIEPHDVAFLSNLTAMRNASNPDMKIVISVGSWNFPSNYFSTMASNESSRQAFIQGAANFVEANGLDGIDLDWEYPNSPSRMDPVEIKPKIFKFVNDTGGSTDDSVHFVSLMRELREHPTFSNKLISFCGQAALSKVDAGFNLTGLMQYVDFVNLMTYDYTVSSTNDTNESARTAPNQPLYAPDNASYYEITSWNVNETLNGYIERGVNPEQMLVGIALYGHTWYLPGCTNDDVNCWGRYGLSATYPGANSNCNNVTKYGWGGSRGKHTLQCGFYGVYEIQLGGFMGRAIFDQSTRTYISYTEEKGPDNYTPAGTWINWQGPETIAAIIDFANNLGVKGAFAFDVSTDTWGGDTWTFEYFNQIYDCVNGDC